MSEKIKLQQFGFQDSQYERPNQPWACGRLCEGKPCHIGPDAKGHCLATADCMPVKKGDRWHCTRPPSRGGACPTGPLPDGSCCRPVEPCQPVRSVRSKRGQVVFWTVAASLGVLAFMLFGPSRMKFIQPGELSNAHGQVLKDTAACYKCHTAAGGDNGAGSTPDAWLRSAFASAEVAAAESQNCLQCHGNTPGLRENPLNPHSFDVATLAEKTKEAKVSKNTPMRWLLARLGPDTPVSADQQLACATCHVEHRGQDHLLSHMSNEQCQACHKTKFNSFAHGHPEFNKFPYERRTRMIFDHEAHTRYFPQKNRQFDCAACHQPDVSERHMMTVKFEQACASCHAEPMENPGKGLIVLHLPGMDVGTLKEFAEEGGPWMGSWPKGADLGGKFSPFMRLLLEADPAVAKAMAAIPPKMQLDDLRSATTEQKTAAVRIAWGVKELFFDVATRGQASLRDRLSKALGRPLTNREIADLTSEFPSELLANLNWEHPPDPNKPRNPKDPIDPYENRWMRDVLDTVPLYREGKPLPDTPKVKPKPAVVPAAAVTPPVKPADLFDEDDEVPPKPPVAVVTPPTTPTTPPITPPTTPAPAKPKPDSLFEDDDDKDAVVLLPVPPKTVTPPVDPVKPPVDPVKPPVDPVKPPVDPVKPPVDPVKPPVDPVKPPIDPVKPPVDPVKPPVDPVKPPVDPVKPPVDPVKPAEEKPLPVEPVKKPADTKGGSLLDDADDLRPKQPLVPVIKPTPDPVKPPVDPVKPPVDPVKPPVDPVKPPVDPVKPPVDPVKPPVDPVKPPVDPVKPPVQPPVTPPPVKPPLLDDTKPSEPQPYARIVAFRGSVQYRLSETKPWRWADVGTPLPATAQVRTGLNSTVTIVVMPDARTTVDKMKVVNIRDLSAKSGSWVPTPVEDDGTRLAEDRESPSGWRLAAALSDEDLLSLVHAQAKKGDLFNEDDDEKPAAKDKDKAKQPAPPAKKGDLFNEDDDEKSPPKDKAKEPAPAKKGGDLFNEDEDEKTPPKPATPPKGNIFDDDEDIKAANKPKPATPPKPGDKKPSIFDEDEDDKPAPPTTAAPATRPPPATLPPEQRVAAGGWFIDDDNFAIRYRPVGHANPFLRQWLTLTAGAAAAPRKQPHSAGKIAFDAMRTNVGASCVKCHSIDEDPDHREKGAIEKVFSWADPAGAGHGPLVINWQTKQPAVDYRPFVKFNHRPHRSLPELQNCKVCHDIVKGDVVTKYQSLDPHDFTSKQVGFRPVLREKSPEATADVIACATCHKPNLAGDSCLKCHNYHITDMLRR